MKKEEKILREEVSHSVPDLKEIIKSSIDWEAVAARNEKPKNNISFAGFFRRFAAPIAACVIVVITLAVLLPSLVTTPNDTTPPQNTPINGVIKAEAKDVYALSALSGAKLLSMEQTNGVNTLLAKDLSQVPATARPSVVTDGDVDGIKDCLAMFGSFVEGNGFTKTIAENTSTEQVLAEYKYVMTLTLAGEEKYLLYYTETATETKTEIDDEEETEISTTFKGLLRINEQEYLVNGKKEIEIEGNEKEETFEITTQTRENPLDYVVITHSTEEEGNEKETSYEYEVYENGKKVSEKEISFEEENGKLELKIEVENKTAKTETEYKIISENDKLFVKYELNDVKGRISITETVNGYVFDYDNGYSETITF